MKLQEVAKLINGELVNLFDYEINRDKRFYIVELEKAPSVEVMKFLYDNDMRVTYALYASADRGRYMKYVINHKRIDDYEWLNEK